MTFYLYTTKPPTKGYYVGRSKWHSGGMSMWWYDGFCWYTPEGFRGPPDEWCHATEQMQADAAKAVETGVPFRENPEKKGPPELYEIQDYMKRLMEYRNKVLETIARRILSR